MNEPDLLEEARIFLLQMDRSSGPPLFSKRLSLITRLADDNERLRQALQQIAENDAEETIDLDRKVHVALGFEEMREVARAALGGKRATRIDREK